jgi:hypothetical protein
MSKSKIVIIAALTGMSIASPAFAQSYRERYGSPDPYHYEQEEQVWGIMVRARSRS